MPAEDEFLDQDGKPNSNPVAHESEEIGENLREMSAACQRADGEDDHADGVPDHPGYFFGVPAENLEVDAGRVGWGDGVGDEAKGNDYGAEFAEAVEGSKAFYDEGALAESVGGFVFGVGADSGGETDAADEGHGEGEDEAG